MTTHRISTLHRAGCATLAACSLAAAQVHAPADPLLATPATHRLDTAAVELISLTTFLNTKWDGTLKKVAAQLPTAAAAGTTAQPVAALTPSPTAALTLPPLADIPQIIATIPAAIVAGALISVLASGVLVTGFLSSIPGLYQFFELAPALGSAVVAGLSFAVAPIVAVGLAVGGLIVVTAQLLKVALPALPLPLAATAAIAPAPVAAVKSPTSGTSTDTTADPAPDKTHRSPLGSPLKRPMPTKTKADAPNPATALGSSDDPNPTPTRTSSKPGRHTPPRSDTPNSAAPQHNSPKGKKPKGNASTTDTKGKPDKG